jgi:RecB family endonuclease NucS
MSEKQEILPTEFKRLVELLPNHLEKHTILLAGLCDSIFDGRIKSTLSKGERILLIKKDSSILLHNSTGMRPVQWQKQKAGKVSFTISNDKLLVMESYRPKTDESFFIRFHNIIFACVFKIKETLESAYVIGDEKDFQTALIDQPDLIEKGLKVIEREKEIPFGYIDIFGKDEAGHEIVIEVKKQAATLADAQQLYRYIEYFQSEGKKLRGILIATHIPEKARIYLETHNLEARIINWQELFPTLQRPTNVVRTKSLDSFLK